jgi:hypothetical protein
MTARLDSLGYARVFRHPRTGELVVDTDSLRRGSFAGAGADFGAADDDDWDDEDDDDDDDDDWDDDVFGDDELGDDELGDDELGDDELGDDDFGAKGRKRQSRLKKRLARLDRREDKVKDKLRRRRGKGKKKMQWGMTAVSGTDTLTAAGSASVKIRLQHHFQAEDITFTGSLAASKVTSIFFGDRVVWSSSDGIDVSVFSSTSFLRGLLKGQALRAGLDITIGGSLPGAGDFAVTLIGRKPVNARC